MTWTPYGALNVIREFDGDSDYTVAGTFAGTTASEGTSGQLEAGVGAQAGGWTMTAGISWTDGGAQDSFVGGNLVLRYSW